MHPHQIAWKNHKFSLESPNLHHSWETIFLELAWFFWFPSFEISLTWFGLLVVLVTLVDWLCWLSPQSSFPPTFLYYRPVLMTHHWVSFLKSEFGWPAVRSKKNPSDFMYNFSNVALREAEKMRDLLLFLIWTLNMETEACRIWSDVSMSVNIAQSILGVI